MSNRMQAFVHVIIAALACFAAVAAVRNGSVASTQQPKRVLALVDDLNIEKTHSRFFQFLRDSGFAIDIKEASEAGLRLHRYGELTYNHLLLFAPKATRFGGDITTENVVKFVDMGGNVLVAAGVGVTGDLLRNLALEFGFELDESGTAVIDHFHYDKTDVDGPHTLIAVDPSNLIRTKEVVGNVAAQSTPFLYRGIALRVDDVNPLAFPVMHASSQAYSYKPGKQITTFPFSIGRSTVLIGSMQARNNARVTFSGSLEFFSDALFQASVDAVSSSTTGSDRRSAGKSGNEPLAQALALWTFKEVGVLRIVEVHHYKIDKSTTTSGGQKSDGVKSTTTGVEEPSEYTVMEDVHYRVRLEEYKRSAGGVGEWVPYQGDDVQLEFVRIDPFIRTTLKPEGRVYLGTQFKVPDVYGVFTFRIDHKRQGLTYVESRVQIPVRPLLHTQYERFIYSAYPYYASAFSMMIGVLLLSLVFVGLREDGGENRRVTTATAGSAASIDAVSSYSAASSPASSVSR